MIETLPGLGSPFFSIFDGVREVKGPHRGQTNPMSLPGRPYVAIDKAGPGERRVAWLFAIATRGHARRLIVGADDEAPPRPHHVEM